MSQIVDTWVQRLKGQITPIGEMSHWERLAGAFQLQRTDLVPAAPQLDAWQIAYAGHTHDDVQRDVDKTTDACIKTWCDLRTDAIWMYVDIAHHIESFVSPEKRAEYFVRHDSDDYLHYKPVVQTIDQALELLESRAYLRHLEGTRPVTHYTPHLVQLLEFQEKMGRVVPVIVGAPTPTRIAEALADAHQLTKWTLVEPAAKVHRYLQLCLDERLQALDFYRAIPAKNGCEFFCCFGGGSAWGPSQLAEFGGYDQRFVEKARSIFPYILWHHCGRNLWRALEQLGEWEGIKAVQYDLPYYSDDQQWGAWCERVARLYSGKRCAANSPTLFVACHGSRAEVESMICQFVEATLPHTTACVMPGCEVDPHTPVENVRAMIDIARSYHPR